jgi:uncharacterized protein (DUF779 family)
VASSSPAAPDSALALKEASRPFDDGPALFQAVRWRRPSFVIDVAPGGGDSFSLEGPDGIHFVARSPSAAVRA